MFAALIVGAILVYACSISTINVKNQANSQLLKNIEEYVATQSLSLLSQTTENNQNSTQFLDIPSSIGNQRFWIRIANDSSGAWVESGFGTTLSSNSLQMNIPANFDASGYFISGSGKAKLQCQFENQFATLTLTSE
jgi:flagellar biosynthesis regulator FlaF